MPASVKWIYELDEDLEIDLGEYVDIRLAESCGFEDKEGRRWLVLHPDGTAVVHRKYAWDGCTPKVAVLDIVFGIPDGVPHIGTRKPKAYYASLLHDVLYQFLDADLPLSRRDADRVFLELLRRDDFAPRWVYFAAVRLFGGLYRRFTRRKRQYHGRRVTLDSAAPPVVESAV